MRLPRLLPLQKKLTSTISTDTMLLNSVLVHAAWGPFEPINIVVESKDPELVPQMQFMARVAQLLVDMVKAFAAQSASTILDRSSSSPAQASDTLETHSQGVDITAQGTTGTNAWPGWPSKTPEFWATPTSAVWLHKSSVALKALSTLNWLTKPEQLQKLTRETPNPSSSATQNFQLCIAAHQTVAEGLVRLLHCCLAGELTALSAPLQQSASSVSTMSCLTWWKMSACRCPFACP